MSEPSPKCGAVKHGRVTLRCDLPDGHQGWHQATYSEDSEINYGGAQHEISLTEKVTWEPVDHAAEATRHLLAGRRNDV